MSVGKTTRQVTAHINPNKPVDTITIHNTWKDPATGKTGNPIPFALNMDTVKDKDHTWQGIVYLALQNAAHACGSRRRSRRCSRRFGAFLFSRCGWFQVTREEGQQYNHTEKHTDFKKFRKKEGSGIQKNSASSYSHLAGERD